MKKSLALLSAIVAMSAGVVLRAQTAKPMTDFTCLGEFLLEGLSGIPDGGGPYESFARAKSALEGHLGLDRPANATWHKYADRVGKGWSGYLDLRALNGRLVTGIRRDKRAYYTFAGLYFTTLQTQTFSGAPERDYLPGQNGQKDKLIVVSRESLQAIPSEEIELLYRSSWHQAAISPRLTGEPLVDAVPSRVLTALDAKEAKAHLGAAAASLAHLPLLGYKPVCFSFSQQTDPEAVRREWKGKILAGVCQTSEFGPTLVFAGRVADLIAEAALYSPRPRPELHGLPSRWDIWATVDGAFGKQPLDFRACPVLWTHD